MASQQAYRDGPSNSYTVVSPGPLTATTLSTTGLITASAGVNLTGSLIADSAFISGGLTCRIPVGGVQTAPLAGTIYSDALQVGVGGTAITLAAGALTTKRLTTTGGRQKRVDTFTANVTLGLDHHVVLLSSVTNTALVATLPSSPVDGQEYIIKCIASIASTPTTSTITVTSGGVKPIIPAGGGVIISRAAI